MYVLVFVLLILYFTNLDQLTIPGHPLSISLYQLRLVMIHEKPKQNKFVHSPSKTGNEKKHSLVQPLQSHHGVTTI